MKMVNKYIINLLAVTACLFIASSCSNDVSYSDRLNAERHATNAFLAKCKVENELPKDSVFKVGHDAPYYRIDPDGNVYMQVINPGDRKNDAAKDAEPMYFRYTRYNLEDWYSNGNKLVIYESNETDMSSSPATFKYKDYSLPTSAAWGYGLQLPLNYLGAECEVNLIIKSQYGITSEIAYVIPFLYHVRYFHSSI